MTINLTKRMDVLQRVAVAAATGKSEYIYREVMDTLHYTLEVSAGSLQLLEDDGQSLRFVATLLPEDLPKLQGLGAIPVDDQSISGSVVKSGEPLLFGDSWEDPKFGKRQQAIAEKEGVGNRSYICVPLKTKDKIIGVLNIVHEEPNRFSEEDRNLAISLASFIAVTLSQAKFLERLERVANTVSTLKLDDVYVEAMEALKFMLGAQTGSLQLLEDDGQSLRFVATLLPEDLPKLQGLGAIPVDDQSISGSVAKSGEPLLFGDSWEDPKFGKRQQAIAEKEGVGNRSYICVPLKTKDKIIGVLNIVHEEPNRFSEEDLRVLTILDIFIAVAIQNARQVEELLESQQIRENMEHSISMADFTNNFSHTINNELGLIGTYVSQLERRLKKNKLDEEFLKQKLSLITVAVNNTTGLVGNLKKFDQITKGEFVDLDECIKEAVFKLRLKLDRDIFIISGSDTSSVYATQQLTEVFINLIRNSWHAMKNSDEKRVNIAYDKNLEGFFKIKVSDTGSGVPPNFRDKLFNLGETTKPTGQGGGYGLWWVRTWLRRRGGDIVYDEKYRLGACFIITLPSGEKVPERKGKVT